MPAAASARVAASHASVSVSSSGAQTAAWPRPPPRPHAAATCAAGRRSAGAPAPTPNTRVAISRSLPRLRNGNLMVASGFATALPWQRALQPCSARLLHRCEARDRAVGRNARRGLRVAVQVRVPEVERGLANNRVVRIGVVLVLLRVPRAE